MQSIANKMNLSETTFSIVSEQGTKMGRHSFIHIRVQVKGGEVGGI